MEEQRPKTGKIKLHNWRDFTKVMKVLPAGKWIYRGHEDASWNLKSGLDRYLEKFENSSQRGADGARDKRFLLAFPRAEYFAISRFCAMSRYHQEWKTNADALMAMQHYGARTRLLDFSTSIMVALFFAYETETTGKERAIYAINYKSLVDQDGMWSGYKNFLKEKYAQIDSGDEQARMESESQIENFYFRQFALAEAERLISASLPHEKAGVIPLYTVGANKRQMAQTGVELMPRTFDWFDMNLAEALKVDVNEVNNPTTLVSDDFAHLPISASHLPTALIKFTFDADMEKDAWQILDQANINAATIYPDIVGIAKSIRYNSSTIAINAALGHAKASLPASRFWVAGKKLKTCTLSDKILSVAAVMLAKRYSHIPVLDERRKVVGIFSEYTLMSVGDVHTGNNKVETVGDLGRHFLLSQHASDEFPFVAKTVTAAYLRRTCDDSLKADKRIGLFLVTENGKEDEPLLGIVTAWDVAEVFGAVIKH